MTETNAKPIEPTCSMCPSYPRIQAELDRLTAELKEREGEVERLQDEVRDACGYAHDMESLAAVRLADQERIEMLERAVEAVLDVVSDDYCPTTKKCPEYGKLVRNCMDHWRKWLMEGK